MQLSSSSLKSSVEDTIPDGTSRTRRIWECFLSRSIIQGNAFRGRSDSGRKHVRGLTPRWTWTSCDSFQDAPLAYTSAGNIHIGRW